MKNEEFLKDVCPNHTEKSKWNRNELLHILELHEKQLRIGSVSNWVMCKDKLPLDHENYLVEGDGQYAVTFYSVRRKEWNVDFKVTKYKDIPK